MKTQPFRPEIAEILERFAPPREPNVIPFRPRRVRPPKTLRIVYEEVHIVVRRKVERYTID
jgi:hypothetical protein